MKILTKKQYEKSRYMLNRYNEACTTYCKQNKTNAIPFEIAKTFPYWDKVNNNLRGAVEVYEFINDIPQKYFLYISKENKATTWNGEVLGDVHFGREYRSNIGDKRQPIDVFAINGKKYYGTYYKSSGDYARIKLYANQ
jgi:hypothetical protein